MTPIAVSTLGLVLIVIAAVLVVLVGGGYVATSRHTRSRAAELQAELEHAEHALAQAHALDKGWDRATLAAAAQEAALARFGQTTVGEPQLVQVRDLPGTDADQAVFRIQTADGAEHRITLGRNGGVWGPA